MKTKLFLAMVCLVMVTACSEKAQGMGGIASDAAPYTGVGASQYAVPGWKAGDKTAWEQQLRVRSLGQNDYARAN
jgi:transcription elongation factor